MQQSLLSINQASGLESKPSKSCVSSMINYTTFKQTGMTGIQMLLEGFRMGMMIWVLIAASNMARWIASIPYFLVASILTIFLIYVAFTAITTMNCNNSCRIIIRDIAASIFISLAACCGIVGTSVFPSFYFLMTRPSLLSTLDPNPTPNEIISIEYLKSVVKYCLNANLTRKQQFRRILAANYFIQYSFHDIFNQTKDKNQADLQSVYYAHCDGFKRNNSKSLDEIITWKYILNGSCRFHDLLIRTFFYGVYVIVILHIIALWIYFCVFLDLSISTSCIVFVVYIMIEIVSIKLRWAYYQIEFCSTSLLIYWPGKYIRKVWKWEEKFETVDDMILGIDDIHYIMFEQKEMIQVLYEIIDQDYVCDIVVRYLWMTLPQIEVEDDENKEDEIETEVV